MSVIQEIFIDAIRGKEAKIRKYDPNISHKMIKFST